MTHKKLSIKWEIFLSFLGFSLIMLVLLWVFQVLLLNSFYKAIKIREVKSYANVLVKNTDILGEDFSAPDNEICASVFDSSGNLIYYSDVNRTCIIHKMPSPSLYGVAQNILNSNTEYLDQINDARAFTSRFNFKHDSPSSIFYATKIEKDDGVYTIVLNSNFAPVNATITTLRTQLIYITIIMLILSFLLSLRISKNISAPIIKMSDNAKVFATGNYDITFEDSDYKEISELSDALNFSAKELSKVENLRRELIANISHDLRTPLTMIIGYSEVIKDLPNENTPENIQVITDEAKRLSSLVNDVLDISKMQSGTQEIHKSEFNLTKSLETILNRYSKLTEKDGYIIKFEKDQDVTVTADELLLSQVIYNLINNAITYTGTDKTVTIRQAVLGNDKVKIEVCDSGEGISPENIPYIWDRYYKVPGQHKRAHVGSGLGLSIVKGILEIHEAEFGVESKVGQGSTFWFII